MKLQKNDLSYFLGKNVFGVDNFQSMFVYQPTFDTLQIKKDKGIVYVLNWKWRGMYPSKRKPLYTAFLHNVKLY